MSAQLNFDIERTKERVKALIEGCEDPDAQNTLEAIYEALAETSRYLDSEENRWEQVIERASSILDGVQAHIHGYEKNDSQASLYKAWNLIHPFKRIKLGLQDSIL